MKENIDITLSSIPQMQVLQNIRPFFLQLQKQLDGSNRINTTNIHLEALLPSALLHPLLPAYSHMIANIIDDHLRIVGPSFLCQVFDVRESSLELIVKFCLLFDGYVGRVVRMATLGGALVDDGDLGLFLEHRHDLFTGMGNSILGGYFHIEVMSFLDNFLVLGV